MNQKLYVSSLPFNMTEEELNQLFSAIGEVASARLIIDSKGKGKGFGFVEMASDDDAAKAITQLNGSAYQGRTILVSEARSNTKSPSDDE